jgi:DHA2 family multidrug resistance protein
MSAGTTRTGAPTPTLPSPASAGGSGRGGTGANQWLTAVLVALATFMEILDTTIANVALRYIAGGLGVSEDEASWVVTTYLVANAIILTASAFLEKCSAASASF